MKKGFAMITGLMIMALGLTACSTTGTVATSTAVVKGLNTDYQNALPVEMQLALGTLKLKGSEDAVDAQTAEQLIPLWEAVESLTSKNGSSPQEIQALYKQIGDTMSPAQIQVISAMQLTQQDIPQIAQELGLDMAAGRNFNQGARSTSQAPSTNSQGGRNFSGGEGGFPGGGFGGDGGFPPGGFGGNGGFPGGGGFGQAQQTPNPSARETAQARFANGGSGFSRISSVWVNAVINYLKTITQP